MAEARDRLSRPSDVAEVFIRRQRTIGSVGILPDESPEVGTRTPFRWGATAMTGTRGAMGVGAIRGGTSIGRGRFGTPRGVGIGRGRNLYRSTGFGRENTPAGSGRRGRGRARGSNSVLPSWYPRTPLQDITAVVRAIERRRARLRDSEGHQESPTLRDRDHDPSSVPSPGAQLEHKLSITTPNPTVGIRACPPSVGKVPKILLDITNQNEGESGLLTPQKKLLNSIDTVEKVVMEELRNLKRTPTAKKAEREKRVCTLMSMR
ncbi:hypothetical protein LguiA_024630 [Lonicera macranthoides]